MNESILWYEPILSYVHIRPVFTFLFLYLFFSLSASLLPADHILICIECWMSRLDLYMLWMGSIRFEGYCIQMNSLLTRLWCIFMVLLQTVHCPGELAFFQFAPNFFVYSHVLSHFYVGRSIKSPFLFRFCISAAYFVLSRTLSAHFLFERIFTSFHLILDERRLHWFWSKVAYWNQYNKKYALTCNAVVNLKRKIFWHSIDIVRSEVCANGFIMVVHKSQSPFKTINRFQMCHIKTNHNAYDSSFDKIEIQWNL